MGLSGLSSGTYYSSKPTSPANHPMSGFNSPRSGEQFPTTSASPRSIAIVREAPYEPAANIARDPKIPFDINPYSQPASTPATSYYPAHYQAPVEHPSRRRTHENTRLPPLNHEDTTLSSGSNNSNHGYQLVTYPTNGLVLDQTKAMRMLPQPVPSLGPTPSPLDRPMPAMPISHLPHHAHEYRMQGSLAALVRAGEIASKEVDEMETGGSS
jgi:hypothetical protein